MTTMQEITMKTHTKVKRHRTAVCHHGLHLGLLIEMPMTQRLQALGAGLAGPSDNAGARFEDIIDSLYDGRYDSDVEEEDDAQDQDQDDSDRAVSQ